MINLITNYFYFLSQYALIYGYFLLAGRSFLIILDKFFYKETNFPDKIFNINKILIYPIIGLIFVGNFLVLINYFLPLKSNYVYVLLLLLLLPNIFNVNLTFKFKFFNIINYLLIPGILIISTFDIPFHYDAGYYHLNTQNWLRESNLIMGFVNIFWPFGMSSISEYLSSVLWFQNDFVYLHFINIIFIQFFYQFLFTTYTSSKNNSLKNISFFIIIFSIFDNFGFSGGRNGYFYIQGVGKQDVPVAILFLFMSVSLLIFIQNKKISRAELILLPMISFFIFQMKVSSAIIFTLYVFLLAILFKSGQFSFKEIIYSNLPTFLISLIWFLKNFLTTGCLIFPLSLTCRNSFDWYIPKSTQGFESVTKESSLYFDRSQYSFSEWVNFTMSIDLNKTIVFNFIISATILYLIKVFLFSKSNNSLSFKAIAFSYLTINILFLIFFGPVPRYAIGIVMTAVALFGLFSAEPKIKINQKVFICMLVLSVVLLIRISSYNAYFNNDELFLFNPEEDIEINSQIGFTNYNENWVYPSTGDQCWINIKCSMAKSNIIINEEGFFKTAYKAKS
ncbi:hypothetical protein OAQ05_01315 [Acidimicrobiia bacterium]|nr:hypothetical protein [Acidimicrobiia bacterium]